MADVKDFMLTDDMALDEVEDMPSFETWETGLYKCVLNDGITEKTVNEHPSFSIMLTCKEIMHQDDPDSSTVKVGSEQEILCMRDNIYGAANWKLFAKAIQKSMPQLTKVGEINENSKGFECAVLLKKVENRKDKGKFFPRIVEVIAV